MPVIEKDPKSIPAENYRTLRTNLQYSSFDKEIKVIVVTSSEPGEGKSTTASNLAVSLSKDEKNVLLIDCDLRKPSQHKAFKLSNLKGLSDVVIGKETVASASHKHSGNLAILTSGKVPPNPSEMLGSKAMAQLLEDMKEKYDYIILDTPPVQAVSDAQILASKADGTLLVVRAEKTKKDAVVNSLNLLKKVNANVLGTVLNAVNNSKSASYYYYGDSK